MSCVFWAEGTGENSEGPLKQEENVVFSDHDPEAGHQASTLQVPPRGEPHPFLEGDKLSKKPLNKGLPEPPLVQYSWVVLPALFDFPLSL